MSTWMTEPPTEPGWYWMRARGGEARAVLVDHARYSPELVVWRPKHERSVPVRRLTECEWCCLRAPA